MLIMLMWYAISLLKESINVRAKQSKLILKLHMLDSLKNSKILSQLNKDQNTDMKKDITHLIL
jgi:uncharacterized protein YecA (UPF0149 family)